MAEQPRDLADACAVIDPALAVTPVTITPSLYEELDARFDNFRGHVLVSSYTFSEDWPSWEMHPAGDELVILQSGRATLVLHQREGDREVVVDQPGQYVVVPRGTWHTARVNGPTRMLFITPGEGTRNEARPPER